MEQRTKNYIEYYEQVKPLKRYSLAELLQLTVDQILDLIPSNQVMQSNWEEFDSCSYIGSFRICKTIDNRWNVGYYENDSEKLNKNQRVIFEITYSENLKLGLIDLFLRVQNKSIEHLNGIKAGIIKISLNESWDNREALGLKQL